MTRYEAIDVLKNTIVRFERTNGKTVYAEALQMAIKALEESQWIPCSETVDIPDHEVLACDKYGEEMLGYLEYADEQWICALEACVMYDPIAWREKPEPYRERREK